MSLLNGLSAAADTFSRFAGAAALEAIRADAEERRLALASEYAATRESRAHGYAMERDTADREFKRPAQEASIRASDAAVDRDKTATGIAKDREGRTVQAGRELRGEGGGGEGYAKRIAQHESGGRMVGNELGSGAFGPYQFMPSTWAEVRKADPSLPEDMKQATPEQHKAAFDRFTASNAEALRRAGLEPTAANLYLAHRFGADGARRVIKADENTPLAGILPPDWQKQNPDMRGQTAGGFRRLAEERMQGVTTEGGVAQLSPEARALALADPEKAAQLIAAQRQQQATRDAPPDAARLAEWWRNATPEQQQAMRDMLAMQREGKATPEALVGYEPDPDKPGALRPVRGGPRDPEQIGRTEAAKEGAKIKTANDEQNKAAGFADRMVESNRTLSTLDKQGANTWQRLFEGVGGAGNFAKSTEYQKFEQARRDFINAVLRKESGAVISDAEFANADRQYFPRPGDSEEVIAQKAKNRQIALDGMIRSAGPTYKPPAPEATGAGPQMSPLDQARDAIARGAPRQAVIERLRQNGIDPTGL